MEELRVAFLVIGSIFIVGVLVHGIWKMRRQDDVPQREQEKIEPSSSFDDISDKETNGHQAEANEPISSEPIDNEKAFDEYGLGSVRVIGSGSEPSTERAFSVNQQAIDTEALSDKNSDSLEGSAPTDDALNDSSLRVPEVIETPLYASVVTQPKPHISAGSDTRNEQKTSDKMPEPPPFLLKEHAPQEHGNVEVQAEPDFGLSRPPTPPRKEYPEQEASRETRKSVLKRSTTRKRKEPTLGEDQMRIDFDEPKVSAPKVSESSEPKSDQKTMIASEVLAINVRASEAYPLSGAALLPLLLTLGFKFGEHDIFHRHVNANGKGPVLFSLANMVKPGVFDIDNLETFTTQGISLFMVLPIEGDPHQVFNMMHNAARKIAEEFDAQLLDGSRSILTKQGVQQYVEKIREFERQRIIASNSTR
jgi:cell division protein ZipA